MKKIANNSPNWSDDTLIIQKGRIGLIGSKDCIPGFFLSETWHGPMEPLQHFDVQKTIIEERNLIKGEINISTKKYLFGFKFRLSMYLLFILIFIFISIKYVSGCDNNLTTSQEEDITRQQLISLDQEAIEEQKKVIDFYTKQKELIDENSRLRDIIEKMEENQTLHEAIDKQEKKMQALELEEKERQIKMENEKLFEIVEKQEIELRKKEEQIKEQPSIAQPSTVRNLENVGKQVVKETDRVVQKTNREVKRILKKF